MPFQQNPSWLRDACTHTGGSWDLPTVDCEPGKSQWLAKGNPEEIPNKSDSNSHEGVTQWLSLSLSLPVCLPTWTVLFSLLINISLASLLSVFVGILFCKTKGPLTTGVVARIWCSHLCDLASISGWECKPRSKPLEVKVTGDLT